MLRHAGNLRVKHTHTHTHTHMHVHTHTYTYTHAHPHTNTPTPIPAYTHTHTHAHTHTQPEDKNTTTLPLLIKIVLGVAGGAVGLFLLLLCCLFCCWCRCCHYTHRKDYKTRSLEYKITAQYWTQGSANYRVTRQDSFSSRIGSRMSSIRSSFGIRPKAQRDYAASEVFENPDALPEIFSTPV